MTTGEPRRAPRRIPQGEELLLLMRCVGYRFTRTGSIAGAVEPPTPADLESARAAGWPVGEREAWLASEIVDRAIAAADALSSDAVLSAFVAGIGGSAPRGRQTIISYAWARHLRGAPRGEDGVPNCGLEPIERVDVTDQLVRLACGWAWNELPAHYLPDLEAAVAEGLPRATGDDRERVRALLDVIASQPAGTTPGALEKELTRARLLVRTDKYQRYGILIGLTELGVLPNPVLPPSYDRFVPTAERHRAEQHVRGGPRSDITLPLAAWRGGVDRRRAELLLEA
ncbi:hypothetical protein GCM10027416_23210 [Okibacterium endophyticum]